MNTFKLYYSIQNGGDGSAYPEWFDSEKLARWDQDHMYEGWGESCDGWITLTSESPIFVKDTVYTPKTYLERLREDYDDKYSDKDDLDNINKFVEEFFPNGE